MVYDPDKLFSDWSAHDVEACGKALRNSPHFQAGLRVLIELLPRLDPRERHVLIYLLGTYEEAAAPAIPALTAFTIDSDALTRAYALGALAVIDPQEPRWPALLYDLRRTETGKAAEVAEWALIRAGQ